MVNSKRHGRLGSQKTTTGCKTCKQRRVKCDEAKPVCMRCKKADRECLGYASWQTIPYRPQHDSEILPQTDCPPLSILNFYKSEYEHRSFKFFAFNASQQMTSIPDENFWTQLVPQLSFSNQAIRYAAIAIGSLFHDRCSATPTIASSSPLPMESEDRRFALEYYNKALNATVTGMTVAKDVQTALITCILFFCMEALQGHDTQALKLYYQGQKLLNKVMDQRPAQMAVLSKAGSPSVDDQLCLVFSRLRILAALFGEQRPECFTHNIDRQQTSLALLEPFSTTSNAIAALSDLMADIHQFIVRASRQKWLFDKDSEAYRTLEGEQLSLTARLQTWRFRFGRLSQLLDASVTPSQAQKVAAIALIQCDQTIISIWLSCVLQKAECTYDIHLESFRTVISLASRVIDFTYSQHNGVRPVFQFELGVIPPLYWVAIKCRDSAIRRLAIDCLCKAPEQEGLWDSGKMVIVAERIIEIEEKYLVPGQWPVEKDRVHNTQNVLDAPEHSDTRQNSCVFMRKPFGLDADWETWHEWL